MEFTIVIPVLDEEQSVEKVARGCLAAREEIMDAGGLDAVNVVVVSDGSTDRSVEIAQSIDDVTTLVFEENRGYGAAIQAGWEARPADLVGFLDGDGTCDPRFFATLVSRLTAERADIALGSRMGADSRMPRLRRLGNWIFATLLGALSRQAITDSASGMRVIRSDALPRLQPLPAGLHFTPSMSARAVMADMKVLEIPMTYAEREGRSKLSVIKDGWRFLVTILAAAATIKPSRLTLPVVALLTATACALSLQPIAHYLEHGSLLEGMVYRFLFMALLADIAVLLFCATLVVEHVIALTMLRYGTFRARAPWWWRIPGLNLYIALSALGVGLGVWLTYPGFVAWLTTGQITGEQMHWSRVVLTAVLGLTFVQLSVTRVLIQLLHGLEARQSFLK